MFHDYAAFIGELVEEVLSFVFVPLLLFSSCCQPQNVSIFQLAYNLESLVFEILVDVLIVA